MQCDPQALAKVKSSELKECHSEHGNPEGLLSPTSTHMAQSYYTLNCSMDCKWFSVQVLSQIRPNSFKLHVSIEVNDKENKAF